MPLGGENSTRKICSLKGNTKMLREPMDQKRSESFWIRDKQDLQPEDTSRIINSSCGRYHSFQKHLVGSGPYNSQQVQMSREKISPVFPWTVAKTWRSACGPPLPHRPSCHCKYIEAYTDGPGAILVREMGKEDTFWKMEHFSQTLGWDKTMFRSGINWDIFD